MGERKEERKSYCNKMERDLGTGGRRRSRWKVGEVEGDKGEIRGEDKEEHEEEEETLRKILKRKREEESPLPLMLLCGRKDSKTRRKARGETGRMNLTL